MKTVRSTRHETIISYDDEYALKLYRRVEKTVQPDAEITQVLTERAGFAPMLPYAGSVAWKAGKDNYTLGILQEAPEGSVTMWRFMRERVNNYYERVLTLEPAQRPQPLPGLALLRPVAHENVPDDFRDLFGGTVVGPTRMLGERLGELHLALANVDAPGFGSEGFSLHYQRSLFSGLQSLVRETFDNHKDRIGQLPESVRPKVRAMLKRREEVLSVLKTIYDKKIDAVKIRIHGDYRVNNVLFTGRDLALCEFGGNPYRSFSERRLRRSPLRDVADMLESLHYVAYASLLLNDQVREEDIPRLTPPTVRWLQTVCGVFMDAYLGTVKDGGFLPDDPQDLHVLLRTYLLEKAIFDFNLELRKRPEWVTVPLRMIETVMEG